MWPGAGLGWPLRALWACRGAPPITPCTQAQPVSISHIPGPFPLLACASAVPRCLGHFPSQLDSFLLILWSSIQCHFLKDLGSSCYRVSRGALSKADLQTGIQHSLWNSFGAPSHACCCCGGLATCAHTRPSGTECPDLSIGSFTLKTTHLVTALSPLKLSSGFKWSIDLLVHLLPLDEGASEGHTTWLMSSMMFLKFHIVF